MPRPGPARVPVVVKFTADGLAAIDKAAADRTGGNRSLFIRECITYALTNMPKPQRGKP